MQDNEQQQTYKVRPTCAVCRHLCDEGTGHEPWCPVYAQVLQQQGQSMGSQNPIDIQELKEEWAMLKQGKIPKEDGYEVARIYREGRERLLEELKVQVEINRRLSRELIDVRLENAKLRLKHEDLGPSH